MPAPWRPQLNTTVSLMPRVKGKPKYRVYCKSILEPGYPYLVFTSSAWLRVQIDIDGETAGQLATSHAAMPKFNAGREILGPIFSLSGIPQTVSSLHGPFMP